jgi:hypothetical protein
MVDVKAWVGCMSSLSWRARLPELRLHEVGGSTADMAQHVVQPLHTVATYKY